MVEDFFLKQERMRTFSANFGGTLHEAKYSRTKSADGDRVIPTHQRQMWQASRIIRAKLLVKHGLDRDEKIEHTSELSFGGLRRRNCFFDVFG